MNINIRIFFSRTALFFTTSLLLLPSLSMAEYQSLEKVIAVVEEGVILKSQLEERISTVRADLLKTSRPIPPDDIFREKILDQLILETIQLQLAEKNGIRVSDSTLGDTMEKIAQQNGKSLSEFKVMLEEEGLIYKEIRNQVRKDLLLSRLRQKMVANRINITEQDVKNYLGSTEGQEKLSGAYQLAHILIATEAQANELYKKVKEGADFYNSAKKYGEPNDLGLRKVEQLPTIFVDPAKKLQIGEVSEPIKSPSGFHLVKLIDQKGGDYKLVNQTEVRHILIKPNEIRSKEDAKHLIDDIRLQIISGKSFGELARTYSEDPVSASDGGDLGWSNQGDFVPEFDTVMQDSEIGEISKPFYSTYGWHILEVTDRREHNVGKEYQLNQARAILQQEQFENEIQLWLREIRQDAFVEIKGKENTPEAKENAS
jgi:peptidyl-prolyl cis-trans isomerase SurA